MYQVKYHPYQSLSTINVVECETLAKAKQVADAMAVLNTAGQGFWHIEVLGEPIYRPRSVTLQQPEILALETAL